MNLLRKSLWLILLAGLIGAGIGYVVRSLAPAYYEAVAVFIAPPRLLDERGKLIIFWDDFRQVIDELDLSLSILALSEIIEVTAEPKAPEMHYVKVTFSDAKLSADIANQFVMQLINPEPRVRTSSILVLEAAVPPRTPVGIQMPIAILLGGLVSALFAGVLLMLSARNTN